MSATGARPRPVGRLTLARRGPWPAWIAACLAAALPAGLWLAVEALEVRSFVWLVDELLYVKKAQGFASAPLAGPEIFGAATSGASSLYSALLAPLYAVVGSNGAFRLGHLLNAVLWASTAVPVVLLGRRLGLSPVLATLTALLALLVPWATSVTVLMTEAAAYPAFAWALYAMTVAVAQPSVRADVLAVAAIAVLALVRTQFLALGAVLVVAILVHATTFERGAGLRWRALGERLRPHAPVAAALVALGLVALVVGADLLGSYGPTTDVPLFPAGHLGSALAHLAALAAGLTFLPAVLGVAFLLRALVRPAGAVHHAFALVGGLASVLVLYQAGFFGQQFAGGVLQERYVGTVALVLALGTGALLADRRRPAPLGEVLAAALGVAAVASAATYAPTDALAGPDAVRAPATAFNVVWEQRFADLNALIPGVDRSASELAPLVTVVLALAVLPLLGARRGAVAGLVLAGMLVAVGAHQTGWALGEAVERANRSYPSIVGTDQDPQRTWVDAHAGDRRVVTVPGPLPVPDESGAWHWIQFWNESVQRQALAGGRPNLNGLPADLVAADPRTGLLRHRLDADLVVAAAGDPLLAFAGRSVRVADMGAELVEPDRPWRVSRLLVGAYPDGHTKAGATAELRFYAGAARRVALTLAAPAASARPVPWRVRSSGVRRSGTVRPGAPVTVTLAVAPAPRGGFTAVRVSSSARTALEDGRRVGVQLARVA